MATHSHILAWEIHGQRSLVGYSLWASVGHDLATKQQQQQQQQHIFKSVSHIHIVLDAGGLLPESAFSGLGFIFQCGMTVKKRNNNILPTGWRVWRPILGRSYLQWLEHRLLSQISWVKCQQQHFFAMFPWAPGLIALGLSLSLCCVGLERLPNRGELNEISHSMVQQIFPDCLLDVRHCFKYREEVILHKQA